MKNAAVFAWVLAAATHGGAAWAQGSAADAGVDAARAAGRAIPAVVTNDAGVSLHTASVVYLLRVPHDSAAARAVRAAVERRFPGTQVTRHVASVSVATVEAMQQRARAARGRGGPALPDMNRFMRVSIPVAHSPATVLAFVRTLRDVERADVHAPAPPPRGP